jgi:cyclic pyranopterin phosphate synthase
LHSYCIPKGFRDFEIPEHWLDFDEIERLVRTFTALGLKKVRLTGGEPLVRRNLPQLANKIGSVPGIVDLSLSTNGTQLEKQAAALKRAGVQRLNVSLDTLNRHAYEQITGWDVFNSVLDGLESARNLGFGPIKINMVIMQGINDHDIDSMLTYCIEHGFTLRLIETMPMGSTEQKAQYLSLQPVKPHLQAKFDLVESVMTGGGPARYLTS